MRTCFFFQIQVLQTRGGGVLSLRIPSINLQMARGTSSTKDGGPRADQKAITGTRSTKLPKQECGYTKTGKDAKTGNKDVSPHMVKANSKDEDKVKDSTYDRHHERNRRLKLWYNHRLKLKSHQPNYAKHRSKGQNPPTKATCPRTDIS